MRLIKIIVISLYTIILGFIVFGNTSVFADDLQQTSVYQFSSGIDDYFLNCQEQFDYSLLNSRDTKQGFADFYNYYYGGKRYTNWNYFVLPMQRVLGHNQQSIAYARGYAIFEYAIGNNGTSLQSDSTFSYLDIQNFARDVFQDRSLYVQAINCQTWNVMVIYDNSNEFEFYQRSTDGVQGIPLSCLYYEHPILQNSIYENNLSSTNNGAVVSAIQSQTNTIANETQKQTNAITTATQQQTNQLLDTNDTGNETMSVNDTTTDTSADLGGLFNQISSSFTDTTSETQKGFDLKLPNGDTHTFTLKANVLTSFLDSNPVLKAFYQAFFYVVFGGYVIFDFKKIINKLKEGNIDNVVGSSSPVDSVVNMSLK